MFLYLSKEGRYWLKGLMLSMVLALSVSVVMPAASAFARGVPDTSRPTPAPTPEDQSDGTSGSSSRAGTTPSRGVSMTPDTPSGAKVLAGSDVSRSAFKPWLSRTLPWDGNWGAFNDSISERLGGTCALDENDQKAWSKFLSYRETFYKKLRSEGNRGDQLAKKFRNNMNEALRDDSASSTIGSLLLGGANSQLVQSIDSYEELVQMESTSPQLAACNRSNDVLSAWLKGFFPNPINLFKYPARFIAQLTLFMPALAGYYIYQVLAPFAFGLALSTPHSERGDLLYHSFAVTAATGASGQTDATRASNALKSGQPAASGADYSDNLGDLAPQKDCGPSNTQTVSGDTVVNNKDYSSDADAQLGFSCQNLNQDRQDAFWIQMANALRSALSAIYGIIVITVALIYLVRRNSQSQYHIKVILPRLFLAVILTMAAPYFIGMLITFSNWMVQALFASFDGSVPRQLMMSLVSLSVTNANSATGAVFANMVMPVLLLLVFDFIMFYLLFVAIGKQLLLIFLIILTPVACLAFVFRDHGKNLFAFWLKGMVAVTCLPVVMAAILAGGLLVANAFWNPDMPGLFSVGSAPGDGMIDNAARYLAAVVLAASMFMMAKSVGWLRMWVTGSKVGVFGRAAGTGLKVGGMGVALAGARSGNPLAAFAGKELAGMMSGIGGRIQRGSTSKGSWIPATQGTLGGATARRQRGGMVEAGVKKAQSLSEGHQRAKYQKEMLEATSGGRPSNKPDDQGASQAAAQAASRAESKAEAKVSAKMPDKIGHAKFEVGDGVINADKNVNASSLVPDGAVDPNQQSLFGADGGSWNETADGQRTLFGDGEHVGSFTDHMPIAEEPQVEAPKGAMGKMRNFMANASPDNYAYDPAGSHFNESAMEGLLRGFQGMAAQGAAKVGGGAVAGGATGGAAAGGAAAAGAAAGPPGMAAAAMASQVGNIVNQGKG